MGTKMYWTIYTATRGTAGVLLLSGEVHLYMPASTYIDLETQLSQWPVSNRNTQKKFRAVRQLCSQNTSRSDMPWRSLSNFAMCVINFLLNTDAWHRPNYDCWIWKAVEVVVVYFNTITVPILEINIWWHKCCLQQLHINYIFLFFFKLNINIIQYILMILTLPILLVILIFVFC
jgi:hypothetical protein